MSKDMISGDNLEVAEIDFWKNDPLEKPESDSLENIINKMGEARVFIELFKFHKEHFENAKEILEIGAGQGWASCIVKRNFPEKIISVSDISEYAIASIFKWEHIFKSKIDNSFACKAFDIPLGNESVDLVYCFEAAHHFIKHERALNEIYRVLKKGGVCLYLNEPGCLKYIHSYAHERVNRKRPGLAEDVLIYPQIKNFGERVGFRVKILFNPYVINRGLVEGIYYSILRKFPVLRYYLPCTMDFIFEKT